MATYEVMSSILVLKSKQIIAHGKNEDDTMWSNVLILPLQYGRQVQYSESKSENVIKSWVNLDEISNLEINTNKVGNI